MVKIRRAYEKVRRASGIVRRGRLSDLPVELYHELDELFRRIFGLQTATGNTNDSLAALLGRTLAPDPEGSVPPPGSETPPDFPFVPGQVFSFAAQGTASANINSLDIVIPRFFIPQSVTLRVEDAGVTATPHLLIATLPLCEQFEGALVSSTRQISTFPITFQASAFLGQTQGEEKKFAPSCLRLRITGASSSTRVLGEITAKVQSL